MAVQISEQSRRRVEEFIHEHKTALMTLLFTDIVGSTDLKQKLGDGAAVPLILKFHGLIRAILKEFADAQEIETAGDSFFIVFAKPSNAVRFALLAQSRLREEMGPESVRMRIGVHLGEVFVHEQATEAKPLDYFGTQVDVAARVMSLGDGDQVLCTRFVFDNARQILRGQETAGIGPIAWLNHGEYRLKGVEDLVEVCEVGEKGKALLAPPRDSEKAWRQVREDEEEMCGWRPAADQIVPNTDWVLKVRLGEGGFGETWKAENRNTGDFHAFKFCFTANRVRSLKREITLFRVLRRKSGEHQPFVRLHNVYLERAPYYLEMEYIDGPNLERWVQAEKDAGRELGLQTKLEIVAQVAEALALAHSESVVHNDVKPSNILMSSAGGNTGKPLSVKLSDFGIGQILAQEKIAQLGIPGSTGFTQTFTQTATGSGSGSQIFMAPELLVGMKASPQSDFYALGVVLYQLYLGNMRAALPADWESNVKDPIIRADLRWLLAGDPERRPTDGKAVAARLRQHEKRLRRRRTKMTAAALAAVLVVLTAAGLAYAFLRHDIEREHRRTLGENAAAMKRAAEQIEREQQKTLRQNYDAVIKAVQGKLVGLEYDEADRLLKSCPVSMRNWEWGRLMFLCHLDLMTLKGHSEDVNGVAVSPDGKRIASASLDWTVKIWDMENGRELRTLKGHKDTVESVAFSPDGRRVASGSMDGALKIWDAESGRELIALDGGQNPPVSVAFSPDGSRLAASSARFVKVWDAQTGKELTALDTHRDFVTSVAWSRDGRLIAAGTLDGATRIWEAASGQETFGAVGPADVVWSVALSPDGKRVAAAGGKTIMVCEIHDGKVTLLKGHTDAVNSVAFSPDGTRLVSGSDDKTVKVWDEATGEELLTLKGHPNPVETVAYSPDGKRIVSGSADTTVKVWDAENARETTALKGHSDMVTAVSFSPDGKRLLSGAMDSTLRVWDAKDGRQPLRMHGASGTLWSAAFSPDGKRIAAGSGPNVDFFDAATGKETMTLKGHTDTVNAVRFSPDGRRVVTASDDTTVRIWDADTGRQRVSMKNDSAVEAVAFSPDGKRVATADMGRMVKVWDAESGRELLKLPGHRDAVFIVAFSPDGARIASGGMDRTAKIWDAATGQETMTLKEHSNVVCYVAFSPDGTRLATASRDRTVKIWDVATGWEIMSLRGHTGMVCCVAFSPDSRIIASGSDDRLVLLWPTCDWKP